MAPYPDDHFRLGRYHIGPWMMAKIIKQNSQVFHRSMYQALTQEEYEWEECTAKHSLFIESLYHRLGPCAMVGDLIDLVQRIYCSLSYDDNSQNVEMSPILDEELEVTPEQEEHECRSITPERGQNGQRQSDTLEVRCWWWPNW